LNRRRLIDFRGAKTALTAGLVEHPPCSFSFPWIGFRAAIRLEVGGDAQVSPLPVGLDPLEVILLRSTNGVAAELLPFYDARVVELYAAFERGLYSGRDRA
jgi:hypothetical protein